MGAPERDPFAEVSEPPLHPVEALHDLAECLELIAYWRTRCEKAEDALRWRKRMAFLKRTNG